VARRLDTGVERAHRSSIGKRRTTLSRNARTGRGLPSSTVVIVQRRPGTGDTASVTVTAPVENQTTQSLSRLWLYFVSASLLYAVPAMWLLRNYLQPTFDLGIYDQSLWLLFHGETFNTIIATHVFGAHLSPILILLSPLSLIPGGAYPELAFQALVIASGVYPVARLARSMGQNQRWFVIAYAIHPAIIGGSWYGFRPWNLAVPVFAWAIYWIWSRPRPSTVIASGLLLLVFREDLAMWVGIAVLMLAISGRYRWRDIWVPGVVLVLASGVVLLAVVPTFSPFASYFFSDVTQGEAASAAMLGSSFALRAVFLFAPLALSPARIRWVLATPLLIPIAGLLARGGNGLTTFYHYDMMFVPLVILIAGLSPKAELRIAPLVAMSLLVLATLGPLRPFDPKYGPNPFRIDTEVTAQLDETLVALLSLDGARTDSLAAPSRLLPHLSERPNAFIFPSPWDRHPDDNSGYGQVDRVEYRCPDPNIVVQDRLAPAPVWSESRDDFYAKVSSGDRYSIWVRHPRTGDQPCDALWFPAG